MRKKSAVTASLAILLVAMAQPLSAAAGWTNYGTIGEINQQGSTTPGNEMVFVQVSVTSNPSDANTCTIRDGFYFPVTTDLQKRLFSMLLTAKAMGQQVRVYVTANCHLWGYAEMQGLIIQ